MSTGGIIGLIITIISVGFMIVGTLIGVAWRLAFLIGELKTSIALNNTKAEDTSKDVVDIRNKVEGLIIQVTSLQARTIRLEEKVDKI